ncbi:MAG: ABC transporter permease [Blautia sp.]|nr:ABC transporter permease [Blautia sp.]
MRKGKNSMAGIVVPLLSIVLALLIGAIIMVCLGANPATAMKNLAIGAFGSKPNIGTTLTKATPLIFTSLCACFAYKCGVFNLGGEGQFIMGSIAAIYVTLVTGITGVPAMLLALAAGAAAGGIWGFLPGILKITRGQNEMITSIMFNYIATLLMGVVYTNWLRDGSVPQTQAVPKESQIPRVITGMRFTWGFVIAVVLGLILYYFLFRTSGGFKLRAVGINATAARFNGFPVRRLMLFSFIVSGAIAGLGGSAELLGTQFRLINGFASGYGFDGVAMALIGQLNPIATIFVALFFAALRAGATTMQAATGVPTSVSDIIQALVIVFTVAGMALTKLPEFTAFLQNRSHKNGKEVRD